MFVSYTTPFLISQTVLNAVIQSGISKCPDGLQCLHMDSQHSALPLFAILHGTWYSVFWHCLDEPTGFAKRENESWPEVQWISWVTCSVWWDK